MTINNYILANLRRPTEHTEACNRWYDRFGPFKNRMGVCLCPVSATPGPDLTWDEAEEIAEEIKALREVVSGIRDEGGFVSDGPKYLRIEGSIYDPEPRLSAAVRRALGEDDQ